MYEAKISTNAFLEIEKTLDRYYAIRDLNDKRSYTINNPQMEFIMDNISSFLGVIDFHNNNYLYVSDSCKSMLGVEPSELYEKEKGMQKAVELFRPDHAIQFSTIILPAFLELCKENIADNGVKKMKMTYTNKLMTANGSYRWFFHQITMLDTDENGMPLIAVKLINDIDDLKTDENINLVVSKKNKDGVYDIILEKTIQAASENNITITTREREIIQLTSQGLSSKSIAEELFISAHTVNTHKKNMLRKLNLTSSNQLVRYAMANGVLY
jgi:DNA-binding CsgD family transcriptional regulator